jgi:hypothetical protein
MLSEAISWYLALGASTPRAGYHSIAWHRFEQTGQIRNRVDIDEIIGRAIIRG